MQEPLRAAVEEPARGLSQGAAAAAVGLQQRALPEEEGRRVPGPEVDSLPPWGSRVQLERAQSVTWRPACNRADARTASWRR